jgi:DNA-binding LytR/AlgR family response regulator
MGSVFDLREAPCNFCSESREPFMSNPENRSNNGSPVIAPKRADRHEGGVALDRAGSDPAIGDAALRRILDSLERTSPKPQRLVIKAGRRLVFLDTGEIDWIEASGNYVRFHVGRECHTVRSGIGQITERLNTAEFVRIHRSTIVSIKKIKELEPCDNGEYIVVLKDGKQLSCSRGYGARLQQLIRKGYSL